MISQSVIITAVIGAIILGAIPLVGGIILLAAHKIKGTSFWAGILAYFIAVIAAAIAGGILGGIIGVSNMNAADIEGGISLNIEQPTWVIILTSAFLSAAIGFSMLILISACMKLRTFKAAVSCGLGFAVPLLIANGITLVSLAATFSQINSGYFDKLYAFYINSGMFTPEMVDTLKSMYMSYTVPQIIFTIIALVGNALIFVSAAVLVMKWVCKGRGIIGALIAIAVVFINEMAKNLIPNIAVSAIIVIVIGAAAAIYAYRMRDSISPVEKKVEQDSFMQTIANSKED